MLKLIKVGSLVVCLTFLIVACAFDPVAYEENKAREHQEHLQQNGY